MSSDGLDTAIAWGTAFLTGAVALLVVVSAMRSVGKPDGRLSFLRADHPQEAYDRTNRHLTLAFVPLAVILAVIGIVIFATA